MVNYSIFENAIFDTESILNTNGWFISDPETFSIPKYKQCKDKEYTQGFSDVFYKAPYKYQLSVTMRKLPSSAPHPNVSRATSWKSVMDDSRSRTHDDYPSKESSYRSRDTSVSLKISENVNMCGGANQDDETQDDENSTEEGPGNGFRTQTSIQFPPPNSMVCSLPASKKETNFPGNPIHDKYKLSYDKQSHSIANAHHLELTEQPTHAHLQSTFKARAQLNTCTCKDPNVQSSIPGNTSDHTTNIYPPLSSANQCQMYSSNDSLNDVTNRSQYKEPVHVLMIQLLFDNLEVVRFEETTVVQKKGGLKKKEILGGSVSIFRELVMQDSKEAVFGKLSFQNVCSYKLGGRNFRLCLYVVELPTEVSVEEFEKSVEDNNPLSHIQGKVIGKLISPSFTIRAKKPSYRKKNQKRKHDEEVDETSNDTHSSPFKRMKIDDTINLMLHQYSLMTEEHQQNLLSSLVANSSDRIKEKVQRDCFTLQTSSLQSLSTAHSLVNPIQPIPTLPSMPIQSLSYMQEMENLQSIHVMQPMEALHLLQNMSNLQGGQDLCTLQTMQSVNNLNFVNRERIIATRSKMYEKGRSSENEETFLELAERDFVSTSEQNEEHVDRFEWLSFNYEDPLIFSQKNGNE